MGDAKRTNEPLLPEERRQARRAAVNYELSIDVGSRNVFYTGLLKNISSGGVFIVTREAHRIGDELVIRFTFPGANRTIQANGVVRWLRGEDSSLGHAGIGVQFLDLPPAVRAEINQYLGEHDVLLMELTTN